MPSNQKTVSVPQAIQIGLEHHQAGRLPQAERAYQQVLALDPGNPDALHLLGAIAHRVGKNEIAAQLISRAVGYRPSNPQYLNTLGEVYRALRQPDQALASYDKALAIEPGYASALSNRGNALQELRRYDEALASYDQALSINPDYAEASNNRGTVLKELNRPEDALAAFDRALAIKPGYAEASYNRANLLKEFKRFDEALAAYAKAISTRADYAEALCNQGNVLAELARHEDAVASYDRAIAINPGFIEALNDRGVALQELRRYSEALASYDKALSIKDDFAEALSNRGNSLRELKRCEEALVSYDLALSIKPDHPQVLSNRGVALGELGRHEEALACFDRALAIRPDYAEALSNRGNTLRDLGRLDEAMAHYARAIAIKPGHASAHLNESLCRLLSGEFERGWREYEWRWKCKELKLARNDFAEPLWLGDEDIAGKTILLHAEQGLGDTIQFVRYAQAVARKRARVILDVQPVLKPLLARFPGAHAVLGTGEPLPQFDYHCPLMSLPLAFGTRLETIPADVPYLSVGKTATSAWRRKLAVRGSRLVGLCWKGSPDYKEDRDRSVRLAELQPLLACPGLRFVSLQKDLDQEERALTSGMKNFIHPGADFKGTAEMLSALDLVISVDTAWAHWAGAIGKPVWLLLRSVPHWCWMLGREDSPWYPSARLFRQARPGDWQQVIRDVKREILRGPPSPA